MKTDNMFDFSLDPSSLIQNREDLKGRLSAELAKEKKNQNTELIDYLETVIESINYQLDNRGMLSAIPMASVIPVNNMAYPRFSKLVKSDGFQKAIEVATADKNQLSLEFNQQEQSRESGYPARNEAEVKDGIVRRLTAKGTIKIGDKKEITERATKEGWPTVISSLLNQAGVVNQVAGSTETIAENIIDAEELEAQKQEILSFLKTAKSLNELIQFAKDFQRRSAFYSTSSYDEILNNVIGSIATEKDSPKDNIYIRLIKDIVEPMFLGDKSSALVAKAIWRLSTDLDIHQVTAQDILISMVYRYSRHVSSNEVEAIDIQNECWKHLVFNPEEAIKDSELKGYFMSAKLFTSESEMMESLADMSDDIAGRIFGEGEIEALKKEKKIKFTKLVESAEQTPEEVREIIKQDPPAADKKSHPAKGNKNKNKRR